MSTVSIGSSGEWDKLLSSTTVVVADCNYLPPRILQPQPYKATK